MVPEVDSLTPAAPVSCAAFTVTAVSVPVRLRVYVPPVALSVALVMDTPLARLSTLAPAPSAITPLAPLIIVTVSAPVPPVMFWAVAPRVTLLVALARIRVSICSSIV